MRIGKLKITISVVSAAMLVVFMQAMASGQDKATKSAIQISIAGPDTPVHVGAACNLTAILTNPSTKPIILDVADSDVVATKIYKFIATRTRNNGSIADVQQGPLFEALQHIDKNPTLTLQDIHSGEVRAGITVNEKVDLTPQLDMSLPGTYTIQAVRRTRFGVNDTAISNTIQIIVLP